MKKVLRIIIGVLPLMTGMSAYGAVAVKKAAPVATTQSAASSGASTAASIVPAVLSLVSGVQQLTQQQKELTAECIPSSQEIAFVDNTMKEWAKTGVKTADEVQKELKRSRCSSADGYAHSVLMAAGTEADTICYNYFSGEGNKGMVWENYPKVGSTTYCADGSSSCSSKNKKNASDIYEIFNVIDFTEADYTAAEATMAAKLISKIEKCSTAKLNARKRQAWGNFLIETMGNVGQSTNTGAIMQSVSSISSGGGLSSRGAIASQFMDK